MEQRTFVAGDRFWIVTLEDTTVVTETGVVGARGRVRRQSHPHVIDAMDWIDVAVRKMVAAGFVERAVPEASEPPAPAEPALIPPAPVADPEPLQAALSMEGTLVAALLDQELLELQEGTDVLAFAHYIEQRVSELAIPRGRDVTALILECDEVYDLFATDAQVAAALRRAA